MSDDFWKKGTEIALEAKEGTKTALMKSSKLFDFIVESTPEDLITCLTTKRNGVFTIELIKILKDEGVVYPRCVKITGDAPKQKKVYQELRQSFHRDFDFLDVAARLDTEEGHPEGLEGENLQKEKATKGRPGSGRRSAGCDDEPRKIWRTG